LLILNHQIGELIDQFTFLAGLKMWEVEGKIISLILPWRFESFSCDHHFWVNVVY